MAIQPIAVETFLPAGLKMVAIYISKYVSTSLLHFRVDISDTLMYVYEMLGAELLSNLYDRLGRQLMDPQQSAVWQVMSSLITDFHSMYIYYLCKVLPAQYFTKQIFFSRFSFLLCVTLYSYYLLIVFSLLLS